MEIAVLGVNHRTAPIAIRERLALGGGRLKLALDTLQGSGAITETVILSTCNRVEIYVAAPEAGAAEEAVLAMFEQVCGLGKGSRGEFGRHIYRLWGTDAIKHLFRVASSLDSMVLGEPQILGQLKTAYGEAVEHKTVGHMLNRAMHRAFNAAKRVRTETQVGEGGISVAYVAAQLAGKIFGTLEGKRVLLVGAGEMAELAAKHLAQGGTRSIEIANRSLARAQALADQLDGVAFPLEELYHLLERADIVITSTGSPRPILRRRSLQTVMRARKYRPLFLIDIAVPRDIEPSCTELDNVYLYDVDDLQQVVSDNMAGRQREADAAAAIVGFEVERFAHWLEEADVVPTIVALRQQFYSVKDDEVDKAMRRLSHLSERDQKLVRAMAHALTNKLLHMPTTHIKRFAQEGMASSATLELVHDMFGLTVEPQAPAREEGEAPPVKDPQTKSQPPGSLTAPAVDRE